MIKIGITGGIGSGKTTVCQIFELLEIPVFYADAEAKKLMVEDEGVRKKIMGVFGKKAYTEEGALNRKYISDIVFKDNEKLNLLNGIVHPAAIEAFHLWAAKQNAPYVLKEAALLFESKSYLDNDYNILVSSPLETRIARVMARDKVSRESVMERVARQMPEEEKTKLADFVIHNNESDFLIKQVLEFHEEILEKGTTTLKA